MAVDAVVVKRWSVSQQRRQVLFVHYSINSPRNQELHSRRYLMATKTATQMTTQSPAKLDVDFVPVEAEPLHKQRWRSETVRLVVVDFPPHTKCLYHQHLKYGVYLVVTPMDMLEYPYGEEPRPLVHGKGSVFCRDHTKDHLIHSAATLDKPAFLIEIELLKEKADVMPNAHLPVHAGIEIFKNDPECRVYGFTLQGDNQATAGLSLDLPTEAVLVALDYCVVEITKASNNKQEGTTREVSMKVGDDVRLVAGKFAFKLVSSATEKAQFNLIEGLLASSDRKCRRRWYESRMPRVTKITTG